MNIVKVYPTDSVTPPDWDTKLMFLSSLRKNARVRFMTWNQYRNLPSNNYSYWTDFPYFREVYTYESPETI